MDKNSSDYNVSRVKCGLERWMGPAGVSSLQERQDKRVLHRVAPHVMKLFTYDAAGAMLGEASAFRYGQHPYVFTAGQVQQQKATRYELVDGSRACHEASVQVNFGPTLDAMLLKVKCDGHVFMASSVAQGDTVYALGFPPGSKELAMSMGTVSSTAVGAWFVDLHTDHDWSGGVLVDRVGRLVGMVQGLGGDGQAILRILAISVEALHAVALQHGVPGFTS